MSRGRPIGLVGAGLGMLGLALLLSERLAGWGPVLIVGGFGLTAANLAWHRQDEGGEPAGASGDQGHGGGGDGAGDDGGDAGGDGGGDGGGE